jgi:hypothetical protein
LASFGFVTIYLVDGWQTLDFIAQHSEIKKNHLADRNFFE